MESLLHKDEQLLIYLNNLGTEQWDSFWFAITNQFNWVPLFLLVFALFFKKFGFIKGLFIILFTVVLVVFTDQFTNFIKNLTERLRPCNVESLQDSLRQFSYKPRGFSFFSGHACLSTTFTVFSILLLKKHFKLIFIMILFPILFGYSRIYLGVHYPIDVTSGYLMGTLLGILFFKLLSYFYLKIFKKII
ncbi:undecaprenyl-diphosphatase [Lutibacter sp. Hel_I_33_5]|uniref:phosphatase PAP2 family protein n=1 Tax=Lutibacter sp. Hel_I_33_5 TaxID=1566289 RepID=UPI0011A6A052|nr:phosphatase PAP2 family protein [Lutibacter sp. Hel_I_33_5]TVZ57369.1 undecaprenyl-diphosphatase [Lutibacter sp. Hel_I_33_5]